MYWIPNMHKNPVGSKVIIASPKCTLKLLLMDITAIFKLFYKKIEKFYSKKYNLVWGKRFWPIQNNKPFIDLINKLNSHKRLSRCQLLILLPHTQKYFMISF